MRNLNGLNVSLRAKLLGVGADEPEAIRFRTRALEYEL